MMVMPLGVVLLLAGITMKAILAGLEVCLSTSGCFSCDLSLVDASEWLQSVLVILSWFPFTTNVGVATYIQLISLLGTPSETNGLDLVGSCHGAC
jgi:hypothetical protein